MKSYSSVGEQLQANLPIIETLLKDRQSVQLRLTQSGRLKIGCYRFEKIRPVDGSSLESMERQGRA